MKHVLLVSIVAVQVFAGAAMAQQGMARAPQVHGNAGEQPEAGRPMDLGAPPSPATARAQSRYEKKQRGCRAIPIPDECLN